MATTQPTAGRTILLADDEESMRKVLERRLASWGYTVLGVSNGREALRVAAERRPDLILLDIMMPELDGLTVCRQLRAADATRRVPILMITARDSRSLAADVQAAGANGFVQKPYELGELMQQIQHMLGGSQP